MDSEDKANLKDSVQKYKINCISQALWSLPVVPATWDQITYQGPKQLSENMSQN